MKFNSSKEKIIFYNIPIILFSLIPFFLITGPFLSDLSISLISLLFLIYCYNKKNYSYFKRKYFYFFLIFCAYLIFNTLINNFNFNSLKISIFYFRYGVFVIALIALLQYDHKFIKYFFYCIAVCFVVLIIDGFYQYFNTVNLLGFITENPNRISSLFDDEQILGSYLSRIWPIFFGLSLVIYRKRKKLNLFIFIILILSQVLIFLSGDRTAFFYIILSSFFLAVFLQKKLSNQILSIFILSILAISIINIIKPNSFERVFTQTLKDLNLINKKKNKKIFIFTEAHNEIYISAYKIFLDNKILGAGVKGFKNKCHESKYFVNNKKICYTHPHNTYIQILTETGLIGFMFLLISLFYFIKYIFKHIIFKFNGKNFFNNFQISILSALLIYFWPISPTGNFFSNWLNICLILNLPFLVWSWSINNACFGRRKKNIY